MRGAAPSSTARYRAANCVGASLLAMFLICKDRQQAGSYKDPRGLIFIYKTMSYFLFDESPSCGEARRQLLLLERVDDDVNQGAGLGRQQLVAGEVQRDRPGVAVPVRQQAHQRAAVQVRHGMGHVLAVNWSKIPAAVKDLGPCTDALAWLYAMGFTLLFVYMP